MKKIKVDFAGFNNNDLIAGDGKKVDFKVYVYDSSFIDLLKFRKNFKVWVINHPEGSWHPSVWFDEIPKLKGLFKKNEIKAKNSLMTIGEFKEKFKDQIKVIQ